MEDGHQVAALHDSLRAVPGRRTGRPTGAIAHPLCNVATRQFAAASTGAPRALRLAEALDAIGNAARAFALR